MVQYTADDIPYGTYLLYRAHNQDKLRSGYVANYTQSVFSTALAVKSNKIWSEISSTSSGFDKDNGPGVVFAAHQNGAKFGSRHFGSRTSAHRSPPSRAQVSIPRHPPSRCLAAFFGRLLVYLWTGTPMFPPPLFASVASSASVPGSPSLGFASKDVISRARHRRLSAM